MGDHILVNDGLVGDFRVVFVDGGRELLNVSDHCLVRAWFKVGPQPKTNWKKPGFKEIEWIKKDVDSLKEFEKDLLKLGKKTSFDGLMRKIKKPHRIKF